MIFHTLLDILASVSFLYFKRLKSLKIFSRKKHWIKKLVKQELFITSFNFNSTHTNTNTMLIVIVLIVINKNSKLKNKICEQNTRFPRFIGVTLADGATNFMVASIRKVTHCIMG